jgi:hypothetical protein
MCPTPLGRIETRVATIWLPALYGLILSLATGKPDWIVAIGVYLLLGVALDSALYSWLIRYQPPWMTFVLAVGEFWLLYVLANILKLELSFVETLILYWPSWLLAISTKVALLPILSLTYLESALEFRRAAWSVPPQQAAMPVLAAAGDAGPGPVVRSASGLHAVPLERLPSPSAVHDVPALPPRPERV